ncbi:major histocompatibility complex class I-related gene protein-like [Scyliorhinus canicula]|uniref:major histocompatibility complex class I-related gene protein-like n=1 Tax=Scyliorhinus canicula TaxID=7830 RepID=UPI0018F49DF3|nr:major histocompatibility complex class I-related gene protein-like [Scyliorhinus canicula]
MRRLMLLVILCGAVSAGSHSLHYFYTAMSPIPGVPDFVVVGYMDDVQIVYYDSVRKEMIPSQRWIAENEGPAYWERYTREAQEWEQWGRANIQILMKKTNQTSVFHTYQRTWGCDLHTDGSTNAFTVFGWDGQDFLFFDKEKMLWQTALPLANSAKKQCDGFKSDNQYWKSYLEQECISNLKKYLKTGERALSVEENCFIGNDKVDAGTEGFQQEDNSGSDWMVKEAAQSDWPF